IEKQDEKLKPPPITRIMRENAPECNIMFIGFVASVLMGASMPLYAILFGEVIGVLSNPDNDEAMKDARYYAFLFIGAGVGAGIAAFLQASMFGIAGEQLTLRMRRKTFAAMLRQEISWYDRDENNTGTLTSRLSGDAASMQGVSHVSIEIQLLSSFLVGIPITVTKWFLRQSASDEKTVSARVV
ncbi:unnamed protein product, partial [Cyprideis torosa]